MYGMFGSQLIFQPWWKFYELSPQKRLNILKVKPLMLYDVSDLLFWCFRVTGSGLIFLVSGFKNEKTRKKSANDRGCVLFKLPVHCCDPLVASFCRLSSFVVFCIWSLVSLTTMYLLCYLSVVKSTLHADNHTSQCIYSRAEERHWLMSTIDSQVRQTGTRWADIGVQSSARKFGSTED